jgi:hypothetical protein
MSKGLTNFQKARMATILDEIGRCRQSAIDLMDRIMVLENDLREWLIAPQAAAQRPAGGSEQGSPHSDDPEIASEPPSGRAPGAAYAGLPHRFQPRDPERWTCKCGLDYQAKVHHNG